VHDLVEQRSHIARRALHHHSPSLEPSINVSRVAELSGWRGSIPRGRDDRKVSAATGGGNPAVIRCSKTGLYRRRFTRPWPSSRVACADGPKGTFCSEMPRAPKHPSRRPMELEYLTTAEAAERLGYTVQHTRRLLRDGALVGRKLGRDWLVSEDSVERHRVRGTVLALPLSMNSLGTEVEG
jgi:excisionase family DNA binding protein